MTNLNLDVRVYPIDEPKGNTLAFASVSVDDLIAINGVRVVASEKNERGMFVAMPQSQDNTGLYHDIAFPIDGDLRIAINDTVLDEYERTAALAPADRAYDKQERAENSRRPEDVKLEVTIYPIENPQSDTLAFASVALDGEVAIRGVRVINSENGKFVSLPQSQDKTGKNHDVASPIMSGLRREISRTVLAEYRNLEAENKQTLGAQLREGLEQVQQYKQERAANPPQQMAAKKSPGLGD
jgi:stage V sporulation protein G